MDRRLGLDELLAFWWWSVFRLGEPELLSELTTVVEPVTLVVTMAGTSLAGRLSDFTDSRAFRTTSAKDAMVVKS